MELDEEAAARFPYQPAYLPVNRLKDGIQLRGHLVEHRRPALVDKLQASTQATSRSRACRQLARSWSGGRPGDPHGRAGPLGQGLDQRAVRQHPRLVFAHVERDPQPGQVGPLAQARGDDTADRAAHGVRPVARRRASTRTTPTGRRCRRRGPGTPAPRTWRSARRGSARPPPAGPGRRARRSRPPAAAARPGSPPTARPGSRTPPPWSWAGRKTSVTGGSSPCATAESNAVMAGCRYSQSSPSSSRTIGPPPPAGCTRTVRRPPSRPAQRRRVAGRGRTSSAPRSGQCGWAGQSGVAAIERSPPAPAGLSGSAYAASSVGTGRSPAAARAWPPRRTSSPCPPTGAAAPAPTSSRSRRSPGTRATGTASSSRRRAGTDAGAPAAAQNASVPGSPGSPYGRRSSPWAPYSHRPVTKDSFA